MNGMTDKDREPIWASRADRAGPAVMVSQEDRVSPAVMASQEDKASPAATVSQEDRVRRLRSAGNVWAESHVSGTAASQKE